MALDEYFARMIAKFGSVEELAEDFLTKETVEKILAMQDGPGKDAAKTGALVIFPEMKNRVGNGELKQRIQNAIDKLSGNVAGAPAAGGSVKKRTTRKRHTIRGRRRRFPSRRGGVYRRQ